MKVKSELA